MIVSTPAINDTKLHTPSGFYHSGGDSVRQCGQDQEWDGDNFRCKVGDFNFLYHSNDRYHTRIER